MLRAGSIRASIYPFRFNCREKSELEWDGLASLGSALAKVDKDAYPERKGDQDVQIEDRPGISWAEIFLPIHIDSMGIGCSPEEDSDPKNGTEPYRLEPVAEDANDAVREESKGDFFLERARLPAEKFGNVRGIEEMTDKGPDSLHTD